MTDDDPLGAEPLQRLLDERAIRTTLARYCRGADRQDYELLRSVYHPDAVDHHGFYEGDVDGFLDWFRTRHRDVTMSMHILANCLIDFVSASSAVVETSCVTVQRVRGIAADPATVSETRVLCRYVDVLECRDGRSWLIAERTVVYESAVVCGGGVDVDLPAGALLQRHDTDDPGLALIASLL